MVMMTVTPADAKPDRMSTTRAALLLSSPAHALILPVKKIKYCPSCESRVC